MDLRGGGYTGKADRSDPNRMAMGNSERIGIGDDMCRGRMPQREGSRAIVRREGMQPQQR